MKGILGRKLEMTQVFSERGSLIPVTVIEVETNKVLQVKTVEKDGYVAVKLGTIDKRANLINKPEMGAFKKANSEPKRFVKEIRDMDGYEIGAEIKAADIFSAGQFVDVTGVSKGKGFAGSIKRHNYSRGPMGHGSGYHRGVGSMGAIINRIFKSKKMPGHMGHEKVTIQNLEIIKVDSERNLVLIKGSVPGPRKGLVVIRENAKGAKETTAVELLARNVKENVAPAASAPKVEEAPVAE
ncbi:50S ribosomal protein L3 [Spiroplasma tabanidicola]|uniref:Large ribosomal subunit protein uL3 n=1 Tax=Spiroplasma tabanidicola TaxID=324079 RepID=A0A6I6CJV4_9MOLU|nr:50S ribosomal protein L3 [Spiroplasma tabanidicola]QGS52373.1 50S ribosomal protein L3 [Spiroplasma tabanidicola]